jgi:hypothetical protein
MMPKQWRDSPWSNELLQVIEVEELLTAPGMHIVKRTRLPLTPAAEYLCDLLRRAKPPEAPPLLAVIQMKDRKLGRRKKANETLRGLLGRAVGTRVHLLIVNEILWKIRSPVVE